MKTIRDQTEEILTILNDQMAKHGDEIESYEWDTIPIPLHKHIPFFQRITESQSFSVYANSIRRLVNHKLYKVSVLRSQITELREHLSEAAKDLEISIQQKQAQLEIIRSHVSALNVSEKEVTDSFAQLSSGSKTEAPVDEWEKMIRRLNDLHHFETKMYAGEYFKQKREFTEHEINMLTTNAITLNHSVGDEIPFECNEFYLLVSSIDIHFVLIFTSA